MGIDEQKTRLLGLMFEDNCSPFIIILSDLYIHSQNCKSTSLNIVSSLQCRCQKCCPVVNNQSRRRQIADECFIAASRRITPPVICYTSNDCQPSTYKTSSTSNKHITVYTTTPLIPKSFAFHCSPAPRVHFFKAQTFDCLTLNFLGWPSHWDAATALVRQLTQSRLCVSSEQPFLSVSGKFFIRNHVPAGSRE